MSHYRIETDNSTGIDRIMNDKDRCTVTFSRAGGELIGYDVYDAEHDTVLPLMWNNNNPEPPADGSWKNHATILFPIVGGLVNKQSKLGNTVIKTRGNHGFARHSVFTLSGQTAGEDYSQIHYLLKQNDEIRGYYPFDFLLELIYTLQGTELTLAVKVTNIDTRPIHFSFGWHPGFSTDMGKGGKKDDWQIIFPSGKYTRRLVDPDCYLTGEVKEETFDGPLAWDEPTLEGTILLEVPQPGNRECTLYNPVIRCGVKLEFAYFPHFGLWSQEGQPFICLEPWQGMDDHLVQEPFDKKVGMLCVDPDNEVMKRATIIPIINATL